MKTGYNLREGSQMLAERIAPDPAPRADGTCVVCRKPLPRIKPQRGVDPAQYVGDPFCSGTCCRAWHGVQDPEPNLAGEPGGKRGRYVRAAA